MLVFKCLLISLLIRKCFTKLEINIKIASSKTATILSYSGHDDKLITENEVNIFNITKKNLNRGFKIELGKCPDNIFLKDPTPYGKLYEEFEWAEIKRRLRVKNAEIIDVINIDTIVKINDIINNTTSNITAPNSLFEVVENGIVSTWSNSGAQEGDMRFKVNINFGLNNLTYTDIWKNRKGKYASVLFGSNSKGLFQIGPGEVITKKLLAKKTIMVVKITYTASLIGLAVGNYENLYGKYHYYAPTIAKIMRAAKLQNEIDTTEIMEIKCYTDPRLVTFNKLTKRPIVPHIPNKSFRIGVRTKYS